jgi:archaellum biogenesis ATPase FlaH
MSTILIGDAEWDRGVNLLDLKNYDRIIFAGAKAKDRMRDVRSAGIAPKHLWWLDGAGRERDFGWGPHKWLSDITNPPDEKYLTCGITKLGGIVNWRLPELVVVAGPYAAGKSLFCQILAQDFVYRNDSYASLTCWEDQADEIRDGAIRYRDSTIVDDARRKDFLNRFRTIDVTDDSERKMSEHFLRIEEETTQLGIRFHVLDPWNEFLDERKRESYRQTDGEYVIDVLTKAAKLVNKLKIILIITTHVAAEYISQGKELKTFRIANAFGTSQFGNKAHRAFCITRTRMWDEVRSHMIVRQDKVKLEDKIYCRDDGSVHVLKKRMGIQDTLGFKFDPRANTLDHDLSATTEARKLWK